MHSFLHQKFTINLIKSLREKSEKEVLLAISGGQDSLCLLKLFLDLHRKHMLQLGVININYSWRYDSTQNTYHIINILKKTCIPIYIYQVPSQNSSELEARNLRYQVILETAHKHKYMTIVTAHSCSDQAETCLYHLFRGASKDGLSSLQLKRHLHRNMLIIRPILNFTRYEVTWFCKFFALPWWSDVSNYNNTIHRNRIRYELIPYLQLYFNNRIEANICSFLEKNYQDSEYLKQNTIKIYQKIKHKQLIAINYQYLLLQHTCIKRRVLHYFFRYNLNYIISTDMTDIILNYLENKFFIKIIYNRFKIQNCNTWLYISI